MTTSTSFKLLLLEPCDDSRSLLTALLELAGCEVRSVSTIATAMAVAATFAPEMILTELTGKNGFGIARQLKSLPQTKDAHIALLTSYYWKGIEVEAIDAGFDQYLLKPTAFDSLVQVLTNLAMLHGKKLQVTIFQTSLPSLL